MLTDAQQAAGAARLSGGHLTPDDRADLLAALRIWLASRSGDFADIEGRLAGATGGVAEKLAGVLILLKGLNFSVSQLTGSGLGIASDKADKRALMIQYALGLIGVIPGRGPFDNVRIGGSGAAPNRGVF